ncbi:PTS sugar transporter subunit IIA [Thermoflexus sp.]|uniref:PTS sugar transporter subunit IIA n=1 Tax=Thermoflexus sp. TaxID=1969742 RepID=UPI0025E25383|nr:PTS sugar transporter subunit IIA [Thermoflexus sp.]MCS6963222.1 PTS sugar transporter subunit IIA [Thermoflexus sp.]MCX7691644.1 PTS sugar transporter subunit IIA [Thermoflexus sp.]MDW8185544.1 PTS sugar transporter subunit IIA [Anaerolineae bacterium]
MTSPDLLNLLPESAIRVNVPAENWREAIRACGEVLAATGAVDPAYIDQMIAVVEELGPYIVIAPGIALAHARPSPAVHRVGFSWIFLEHPVPFGHAENDPVRMVIGLAAPDPQSHVQALATLAELLADEACRAQLLQADTPAEVRRVVRLFAERKACAEASHLSASGGNS